VARRGLGNIRLFIDDARLFCRVAPPIGRVCPVPDPITETRRAKRRLIAPATLGPAAAAMSDGELRLATDDRLPRLMLEHAITPGFAWRRGAPRTGGSASTIGR
jgi:tRNA G46 methylase TrmB